MTPPHPSDPVETPLPSVHVEARHGRSRDGGYTDAEGREPSGVHAVCLHPELINVVRQSEKRRLPLAVAIIGAAVTVVIVIAGVLYSQGAAAGATTVRVQALEVRASEDRSDARDRAERQRQLDAIEAQRHEELMNAVHGLDSRMGRIEERLAR